MSKRSKRHRICKRLKLVKKFLLSDKSVPCFYCDKKFLNHYDLTMDHVIARCRGGMAIQNNLVLACPSCNEQKSNRPILWNKTLKENKISEARILVYMQFAKNKVPKTHKKFNL